MYKRQGGDSALDWAIELSHSAKVNLIHRRDGFSGAESSVQKVKDLNDEGKINLYTKYQIHVSSLNSLYQVQVSDQNIFDKTLFRFQQ